MIEQWTALYLSIVVTKVSGDLLTSWILCSGDDSNSNVLRYERGIPELQSSAARTAEQSNFAC